MKHFITAIAFVCFCSLSANSTTIGDIDGDDQITLAESIYALKVMAGEQTPELEAISLTVRPVFGENLQGLGTPIRWIRDRIGLLSRNSVSFDLYDTFIPTDQILQSVSDGNIDAAHGWAGYHPIPAAVLFGSIPLGPEVVEYLAWILHGNGSNLWQQLYDDNGYNVKVIPCGVMTAETGGWYNVAIESVSDFSGLTIRSCGLAALALQRLGANTTCVPGSQIYGMFERNEIDAAEFSTPAIDSVMNFSSVANYNYFPGWHQPSLMLELLINNDVWNSLSDHQQAAIDMSCRAVTAENMAYSESIQSQYILDNAAQGVENRYFPEDVLNAFETEMATVMAQQSAADADFNAIYSDYLNFHDNYRTWLDLGFNPRR